MNKEEIVYGEEGYYACKIINNVCPYTCECEDCKITKAIEETKELAEKMCSGEYEREKYEDYHADDYKRNLEDKLIGTD